MWWKPIDGFRGGDAAPSATRCVRALASALWRRRERLTEGRLDRGHLNARRCNEYGPSSCDRRTPMGTVSHVASPKTSSSQFGRLAASGSARVGPLLSPPPPQTPRSKNPPH